MEIDEAGRMLAAPTLVVDAPAPLEEHKAAVAETHAMAPQKAALAAQAFAAIEAGIAHLASLGHRFGLVRLDPEVLTPIPFPVMVYRDGQQGLETLVVTDAEGLEKAHEEGWRDHPTAEEAKIEPEPEPPTEPPTPPPPTDQA